MLSSSENAGDKSSLTIQKSAAEDKETCAANTISLSNASLAKRKLVPSDEIEQTSSCAEEYTTVGTISENVAADKVALDMGKQSIVQKLQVDDGMHQKYFLEYSLFKRFDQQTLLPFQVNQLIFTIVKHFRINNREITQKFIRHFQILDHYKIFDQNVGFHFIAVRLLLYLHKYYAANYRELVINSLGKYELIFAGCVILTQKYFIDHPYNNYSICSILSIPLDQINAFEIRLLEILKFELPFRKESFFTMRD